MSPDFGFFSYRLRDVTGSVRCILTDPPEGKLAADRLAREFADADGRARFAIYDYGPGDEVTIKRSAVMAP